MKKNTCLIILDGWGIAPSSSTNAIDVAHTPHWDSFIKDHPHTKLSASGLDVGLPDHTMGNSEVGHLSIGAGRRVLQTLTHIDQDISTGEFENRIKDLISDAKSRSNTLHLMGLVSDSGVHSHLLHITTLCDIAVREGIQVYIHTFTDGRDSPPTSGLGFITHIAERYAGTSVKIASIVGRYYAMDRDHRYERTKLAYDLLFGVADYLERDPIEAISHSYERGETDEFIKPILIEGQFTPITDADTIVFMNFRADRARQLTASLVSVSFDGFERKQIRPLIYTLTEYEQDFPVKVLYKNDKISNNMGEYISKLGLSQLRIAETEKYAHVTFFFNGGDDIVYDGEDTILVSSPKVATYDLSPAMSSQEITDKLVEKILEKKYDFIVCNFANADMVGHTGLLGAAVKSIEALDICLGRIKEAIDISGEGCMFITADHGNAEQMELDSIPSTQHSLNLVPFVYVGKEKLPEFVEKGTLYQIAPTILEAMGLEIPPEMTRDTLFQKK